MPPLLLPAPLTQPTLPLPPPLHTPTPVIGAAAFSSGVTRAVSTAVIVFELSGQSHLVLPISVALLIAYFVANRFTKASY